MKGAVIVCFLALAAVALARPNEDHYTDRYDGLDLQEILDNEKLLEAYSKCLLGKGPCTSEGKELKSHIHDAITTDCAKCTKHQREGTELVITHLIKKKPDVWTELKDKYDPSGEHSTRYEDRIKAVKA